LIILLSPAKRQAGYRDGSLLGACGSRTEPLFAAEAAELRRHLARLTQGELASLFSLSEKKAEELYRIYHGEAPRRRALDLFRGPAFGALLGQALPQSLCGVAGSSLRILSGLYGVLRPFDVVERYRLDLEHRLPGFDPPNLYDYWRERVTTSLLGEPALSTEPFIIDLASKEYSRLISWEKVREQGISRIRPDFVTLREGRERRLSVHAKQGRGGLAGYLLARRSEDPESFWEINTATDILAQARWDGFELDRESSTELRPLYLKRE
jgi:hypothetical protein